ncbi:hypothetical protein HZC34_05620 [Candidatus Saganbacteria bacterium]|nr:hypothetical protein [Candidatus Saganbacteria bacterium]
MAERISKILLSMILTLAVLTGAWLGFQRHGIESESKTIELAMDYNDLKTISALSHYSFDKLLGDIKERGVVSIGVREETLSEASTMGEIYYVTGSGIARSPDINLELKKLARKKLISGDKTYIISTNDTSRTRIAGQLSSMLPEKDIIPLKKNIVEISQGDVLLKDAGVGLSEAVTNYLSKKGFRIIPRLWNDPRYNIKQKIASLKGHQTIIFDGDEITGYPENIKLLAKELKKNGIKFGNVEIVKQDGDKKLRGLMNHNIVRVHSIPKDELKKLGRDEAIDRFVRAAKERSIRLIYIRPFLPPQIIGDPIKYNLSYLSDVKASLANAGFNLGPASKPTVIKPFGWQVLLMGIGVVIGGLLLINYFIKFPEFVNWITIVASAFIMVVVGAGGHSFILEKTLAFLAAITFPAYAMISQFSKKTQGEGNPYINALYIALNVVADTALGIILIVGLLANTTFMLAAQTFAGIKFTLIIPVLLVAIYFFFKTEEGFDMTSFKNKLQNIMSTNLPVWIFLLGLVALGSLAILLARSGNFVLPVPEFEKTGRLILEKIMSVRPRTKEFLIGYPFLMISAFLFLKDKKQWLPVLLAIAVIGPVSTLNSFCHIHSALVISIIRSVNGLVLGVLIGWLAWFLITKYSKA